MAHGECHAQVVYSLIPRSISGDPDPPDLDLGTWDRYPLIYLHARDTTKNTWGRTPFWTPFEQVRDPFWRGVAPNGPQTPFKGFGGASEVFGGAPKGTPKMGGINN